MKRLYIHVPFCQSKCGYCAFYSLPNPTLSQIDAWLQRVLMQIRLQAFSQPLHSIFIGGGTPSLLNESQLETLLSACATLPKSSDFEFTIESNPESLTLSKAELMLNRGVNRISLGAQTLQSDKLKILQRHATPTEIVQKIKMLQNVGFSRLNADLIYAIPTQTLYDVKSDVEQLLDLGIEHLSAYSLTREEGTALYPHFEESDTECLAIDVWEHFPDWIQPYGLRPYEVSNYAKPDAESRHNLGIWLGDSYLGLGPSATSFDGNVRWTESNSLSDWLAGVSPERDEVSPQIRAAEILAFGLRTTFGWDEALFEKQSGFNFSHFQTQLDTLNKLNLIEITHQNNHTHISPTRRGLAFWNTLAETLL